MCVVLTCKKLMVFGKPAAFDLHVGHCREKTIPMMLNAKKNLVGSVYH